MKMDKDSAEELDRLIQTQEFGESGFVLSATIQPIALLSKACLDGATKASEMDKGTLLLLVDNLESRLEDIRVLVNNEY